ncbi:hypothetical protein ACFSF0_00615 [Ottowia flava]|uniref:MFS transporter n=2 Tax=Ottowia TaxID=219181 RepID=A0ABW4KM54_9BURK
MRWQYLIVWALAASWPLAAAANTFALGVQGYDWESLGYAVATSLVGAAFKTAFTLSSTRIAVLSVMKELWRDGVAAAIAGVVMYLAIGAWGAVFTPPHFLLAMPLLFAAGWARGAFLSWTEGRATHLADTTVESIADRIRIAANPRWRHHGGMGAPGAPGRPGPPSPTSFTPSPDQSSLQNPDDMEP